MDVGSISCGSAMIGAQAAPRQAAPNAHYGRDADSCQVWERGAKKMMPAETITAPSAS